MERHEYAEAAHLLEAVQQLSSHFQSYVHIPKVAELKGRLMTLEKSLQVGAERAADVGQGRRSLARSWLGACGGDTPAVGWCYLGAVSNIQQPKRKIITCLPPADQHPARV